MRPIRKVLVANRGEIAVRVARTCRELGITTVAVHSDPDADAPHVRACDEAVSIGGAAPATSYLRGEAIVAAALAVGADAVHPGYGFLAENAGFAARVEASGLVWIGPSPDVIAAMGDKLEAKALARGAGVPVLDSVPADEADRAELPVLVKAAAGGGGKGMRLVRDPRELGDAIAAARREAASAFGDDRVFLERFVERPRHVEVQILGDTGGRVVHLFERECSIQRRHQKVVEETPSPVLSPSLREAMGEAAVRLGEAIGYTNAGTVEFVVDADAGSFHFLEVNTRLQVEHPVTELVVRTTSAETPTDLVRLQLRVASGEPLPFTGGELRQDGHAIEVRLYAEDPANGYLPATGTLHGFVPGEVAGVRWDAGVESGSAVGIHYDPLLAKVIAHAPTRREAAARLARALETTVIHGVVTNRDLLVAILRDDAFLAGDTTTAFLDERFPEPAFPPSREAVRLGAIALTLHGQARRRASARVLTTIPSGWGNTGAVRRRTTWRHGDDEIEVGYRLRRDGRFDVDGATVDVVGWRDDAIDLAVDGHRSTVRLSVAGTAAHAATVAGHVDLEEVPRFPAALVAEVPGATRAPMPGTVVAVAVAEGADVAASALLVTLEAMKMEHRIVAPHDGTVTEVRVVPGQQVDANDVLVVVDPAGRRGGQDGSEPDASRR